MIIQLAVLVHGSSPAKRHNCKLEDGMVKDAGMERAGEVGGGQEQIPSVHGCMAHPARLFVPEVLEAAPCAMISKSTCHEDCTDRPQTKLSWWPC